MNAAFMRAIPVLKVLKQEGHEAYFVGGSVRDSLLKREVGDVDIATSATPEQIINMFPKTVDIGKEHGTIIVVTEEESYEVTTFRSESTYSDNRRPDSVTFIKSLKEDLRRRDFTINAMAMTETGSIIDYFQGKEHLKQKKIHTVGNADERFSEDALRMLRAARFSSQLKFTISLKTVEAMKANAKRLAAISVERKTVEFEKLLKGVNIVYALNILYETNLLSYLPRVSGKVMQLTQIGEKLEQTSLNERSELWTAVVKSCGIENIELFLQEWKLPKKVIHSVMKNVRIWNILNNSSWDTFKVYEAGITTALEVERIRSVIEGTQPQYEIVKSLYEQLPIRSKQDLAINGTDLIHMYGKKPGKWVSDILNKLEEKVLEGTIINTPSTIKEWVLQCKMKQEKNY
ncbi:CCA tRNA nucleotidyltransferase [Sutcliffiella cohnii]|uniref:CCA-adding enzyme n=1 Tax=Sutcliffiella cohnii TaxID=33932 RepID=A0A223KS97_9BACI|nr:CCA tRNA nucleotidyltransferase [Sutcliffiella cohnii]AST92224.1 CCA tRNA nucleotidyltransferase [Sutcliffiella cohnii]MED4017321.1 CCA tRNA nucleotidyltransferase [Sutcliffiella cohnii]